VGGWLVGCFFRLILSGSNSQSYAQGSKDTGTVIFSFQIGLLLS